MDGAGVMGELSSLDHGDGISKGLILRDETEFSSIRYAFLKMKDQSDSVTTIDKVQGKEREKTVEFQKLSMLKLISEL